MKIMILFISFLLISCSTVKSNMVDGQNIQEGISYFLPKRLHKVKITANLITANEAAIKEALKDYEKAAEAKRKAEEECDAAKSECKKAEEITENAEGEAKKKAEIQKGLALANLQVKKKTSHGASVKETEAYEKLKRAMEPDELSERKAKEAFEKAAKAKKKAEEECDAAKSEYNKADEIVKNAVGEEAKREAEKQRGIVLANLQAKKDALCEASIKEAEAYEKLRKALESEVGALTGACNYQVKFSVEAQPLVPDHNYGFVANLKHYLHRTDELTIKTTDTGLLSSTESKSTDTTGDILAKLAQAIISFGVQIPLPSVPSMKLGVKRIEEKPCESLEIDSIVDLSNSADIKQLNDRLKKINMKLQVCGYHIDQKSDKLEDSYELKVTGPPKVERYGTHGLFYRRELPYLVKLLEFKEANKCDQGSEQSTVRADALVLMPNLSPITRLDYPAGLFATSKQKVDFNNGMLVSYNTTRPSEVLGLASIPADIAKSMISVLTQVFTFRIDYSSKQLELAKKQSELIDVLNEMVKKMNKGQAPKSD